MNLFLKKKKKNSSVQEVENKSTKQKRKSWYSTFLNHSLLVINLIFVVALIVAHFSKTINPKEFIIPSYLGLVFPYILLVLFAFILIWIVRFKLYFLISLVAICFCWSSMKETFPLNRKKECPDDILKVMSYNVHLFNFYTEKNKNEVLKYLKDVDVDVICMQEFGYNTNKKKNFLTEEEIIEELSPKYPYFHIEINELQTNRTFGVATFSKYPIIREDYIPYESKFNSSIISTIVYKGKAIKIFNCHLESNKLTENDKKLLRGLSKNHNANQIDSVVSHLSKKMAPSYYLRADQADTISSIVNSTNEPIILCGDFNDVPVSYVYNKMKGEKLKDCFEECGKGYGYTFVELPFWFRIDHILYTKDFEPYNFRVENQPYSDHLPVFCDLSFSVKPKN